jgi:cyclopropane fatty-acyl-phospholipid synthase-like methyltransferase
VGTATSDRRRRFLDRRREVCRQRYDELHASVYDERWGAYENPTHAAFLDRLAATVPAGAELLDAACGTGKYWPRLLAAGCRLTGVDQSAGMLARAAAKHPGVPTRRVALQELAGEADLAGRFDGLLCVDALENVGPEDWPVVLTGFAAVLRPGAPAYLTVELPEDGEESDPTDEPLRPGELLAEGAYHHYPAAGDADRWLAAAGFTGLADAEGDGYRHLLVRRS